MKLYGNTDIGRSRSINQDCYENTVLSEKAVLSVVCDGMGGANAGNIASKTAVEKITQYIKNSYFDDMDASSVEKLLRGAVSTANIEIFDMSQENDEYSGMGTTAVVALVRDCTAYIVHVGDSRAYLIDEGITQITRDHSIVQNLVDKGEITSEEARIHPNKNVITRAVGAMNDVQCDYNEVDISEKTLLICTDGLCGMLTDDQILDIVKQNDITQAADKLIYLANSLVSTDNITVTLVTE